jgi:hypothetical protein
MRVSRIRHFKTTPLTDGQMPTESRAVSEASTASEGQSTSPTRDVGAVIADAAT